MNTSSVPSGLSALLSLAGRAVWHALHGTHDDLPSIAPEESGGAFVTLQHRGALAGCIGFVESDRPLWRTVVEAAEGAVLRDPRFPRLGPDAVAQLRVELSVLSPLRTANPSTFDLGVDGLALDTPAGVGLLLPQVATEHGLDREQFLDTLAQKAELPRARWLERGVTLRSFTVRIAAAPLMELVDEDGSPR